MTVLKAAVVQMRSGTNAVANVAAMQKLVREAAGQGARYIQTPEMTGLVEQEREAFFATIVPAENDPIVAAASRLAEELGIFLHVGSTPVRVGDKRAANRAFVFDPDGELITQYDKIHMFDVDLDNDESWRESAVYRPGKNAVMVDIAHTKVGLGICYDCRFPELHLAYAKAGVEILTSPSCFTRQTGQAHWHVLMRSRAIENGAFMVSAAQGGDHEDGRTTFGHSIIIDPWGEVLAEVVGEEPGVAIADINPARVAAVRAKIPNLKDGMPFTLVDAGKTIEQAQVA